MQLNLRADRVRHSLRQQLPHGLIFIRLSVQVHRLRHIRAQPLQNLHDKGPLYAAYTQVFQQLRQC